MFSPWLTQRVRLYANQPYAEFEWTVGPIPFADALVGLCMLMFSCVYECRECVCGRRVRCYDLWACEEKGNGVTSILCALLFYVDCDYAPV